MTEPSGPAKLRAIIGGAEKVEPAAVEAVEKKRKKKSGGDGAGEPPPPEAGDPGPQPDDGGPGGRRPRRWQRDNYELPADCPVKPLGRKGREFYFQDEMGQFVPLCDTEFSNKTINALFGRRIHLVEQYWPRLNARGNVTGTDGEMAQRCLMGAASGKGVWDAGKSVRGVGGWATEEGDLILHMGDRVMRVKPIEPGPAGPVVEEMPAGLVEGFMYPTGAPVRKAADYRRAIAGPAGPAAEALAILKTWNWARPVLDPYAMLGWIGSAMLTAALKFRPLVWVTGMRETGKSTLQRAFLKRLLGDRLLQVSNATVAGIWQTNGTDSRAVAIDEGEPDDQGERRVRDMLRLARDNATGGLILRGGSNHQGSKFEAQCAFLFSSILVPPMEQQDRSRFAVLELKPLEISATGGKRLELMMPAEGLRRIGDELLARIVTQWWRFEDTLMAYRVALLGAGLTERGADLWGTLGACADVLLHDGAGLPERVAEWLPRFVEAAKVSAESALGEFEECVDHLLTFVADSGHRNMRQPLAMLLDIVAGGHPSAGKDGVPDAQEVGAYKAAEHALASCGLHVMGPTLKHKEAMLCVAAHGQHIAKVFAGSKYHGGGWSQVLRRHGEAVKDKQKIAGGSAVACTSIPLRVVLGWGEA